MTKISKDKRDKIILIGMGTAIVCAALWFLLVAAQRGTLERVRKDVEKSRAQLEGGQRAVKGQAMMKEEYETAFQALHQREAAMASPNDMYLWQIEEVSKFRANYKVEIPQFGRETMSEVGAFAKFPYQAAVFNLRGSACYHDFGQFLADFENAYPYIRVQNIDLEPASGENVTGDSRDKLNFKMELLTLVRPNAL